MKRKRKIVKKITRRRVPRLPTPELHDRGFLPRGSQYWETRDGMYRLVKSEWCDGIEMPVEWKVWRWYGGGWRPAGEFRSKAKAVKQIALYIQVDDGAE